MNILLLLVILGIFYFSFDTAYALSEVRCTVNVTTSMYPVYYNGDERNNPDNSFYPGDGFHYLFKYSADDTCIGFSVNALNSGGAINVMSHDIQSNMQIPQTHSHEDYNILPKILKTTHYFIDRIKYQQCENSNGRCSTITEAENPSYSIREDQDKPSGLKRLIESSRTASMFSLRTEITNAWGLTIIKSGHTHNVNKHIFEDDKSITSFNANIQEQCSNLIGNNGCMYGHAEIKINTKDRICLLEELEKLRIDTVDVEDECIDNPNKLSLTVSGYKKVFYTTKTGNTILKQVKVTRTVTAVLNIHETGIDLIFENPPIIDIDGYDSKNLDSTYYVNDFPAIHVKPNIQFRDIRNNTLTFDVTRINNPLGEISTDICKNQSCLLNLANSYGNFTGIDSISGDRIDVFEAKSLNELGIHKIKYDIKLFNIDRQIQDTDGTTEIFIVDYDPKFDEPYPFVDWDSIGKTSLEKLHSIGLHYTGSQGSGKNGDDSNLHELRRAKINDYYYVFFGQTFDVARNINEFATTTVTKLAITTPIAPNNIGETTIDKIEYYEDLMINLPYLNITAIPQGGLDVLSKKPYPSVLAVIDPSWDEMVVGIFPSLKSNTNNTVMFEREGYGRLLVMFDNLADVVDQKTLINATVFGVPLSSNFGGHDMTYLASYEYLFPHVITNMLVNVTGIHSNGTPNNDLEISVMLSPYLNNDDSYTIKEKDMFSKLQMRAFEEYAPNKTVYIPKYLQEHARVSGIDNGNVAMQIADFHDITNSATYTGSQMVSMNKSIVYIPEIFWEFIEISNSNELFNGNKITPNAEDFFRYSEYVSFNVPGLYVFQIDANGKTKKYPAAPYLFGETITELVNVDKDNKLSTIRFGDTINILPSQKFGNIVSLNVNDTKLERKCLNGCFFILPFGRTANIDAYNIWGGMANTISSAPPPMTAEQEFVMLEKTLDRYLPYMLVSAAFFFSYTIIKRAKRRK